ncbi:MAG: hypothetical protein M3Z01_07145 [Thermoproteota archaeon]|nr:hypothetical protein [Thermoproteota archaeon]
MNIKINDNKNKDFEDDYIVIAIDSIGIKATNRGQYIWRDKWTVRKKGYLKIYIAVDLKSKILSMMR